MKPKAKTFSYYCRACGKHCQREAVNGKPKRWMKSFCESTGRDVRIYLVQKP